MKPQVGDRIRLLAPVKDDYPPPGLPVGLEGSIDWVGHVDGQIGVMWDNGRRLLLLDGDRFEIIETRKG